MRFAIIGCGLIGNKRAGALTFHTDGRVEARKAALSEETIHDLEDNLLLFFTGYSRSASEILKDQKARSERADAAMIENLHRTKELGYRSLDCLERGDTPGFAALMHEHWLGKRARSAGMSNERINGWYDLAMSQGALGGKLIGAGGGGFLMFYATDRARLRKAMLAAGLQEVRFQFDFEGTKILTMG